MVAAAALTVQRNAVVVVEMVVAGVLARIVERDQIEPSKERLDVEMAAVV